MQAAGGASLSDARTHPGVEHPPRTRLFAVVAVMAYLADVSTKVLAVEVLAERAPVEFFDGFLRLSVTRNPGAAFSVGTGYTVLLTLIALAVVAAVLRMSRRLGSRGWAVALGLLLGGALGNLTDRLFRSPGPLRGHVVDFLAVPHWPVFNVADSAIVAGAVLIVVLSLRGTRLEGGRLHR